MPTKKKIAPFTFKEAVNKIEGLSDCWKPGLQALEGKYRNLIEAEETMKFCGSLDLDHCLTKMKYNLSERKWDYIICYDGKLYFVEVHSASTSDKTEVIEKKKALKDWLNSDGKDLKSLDAGHPKIWLISPGSGNQVRSKKGFKMPTANLNKDLARQGIVLQSKLRFPLI